MTSVFVFGSNREGRHGKGAALYAREHYGAINGQASGRQGNSYAIVTKELRKEYPIVRLHEVQEGVDRFLKYVRANPDIEFILTPIGCGLAGFTHEQIAPMFKDAPDNVILPSEFQDCLDSHE